MTVGKDVTLRGWAALFIDKNKAENYGITANVPAINLRIITGTKCK